MSELPNQNVEAFNALASALRETGLVVINPAEMMDSRLTYDEQLAVDLAALDHCASIALLPGWQGSNGARKEVERASLRGITIYFSDGVRQYLKSKLSDLYDLWYLETAGAVK